LAPESAAFYIISLCGFKGKRPQKCGFFSAVPGFSDRAACGRRSEWLRG
jgi:hypothetical protein